MFDFTEQVALVTGGATGIGRATCEAFARAGARVVVADINNEEGIQTAASCTRLGADAVFAHCDEALDNDVADLFTLITDRFGRLDCAFNNAGIEGQQASIVELSVEDWSRTINVNLSGVYRCLYHEARVMQGQQRGSIASPGVRVNAVCPAFIETPMLERAGLTTDPEIRRGVEAMHPVGRLGRSTEVAEAVLWLCSPQSAFVTGHALMVDGGYVAR